MDPLFNIEVDGWLLAIGDGKLRLILETEGGIKDVIIKRSIEGIRLFVDVSEKGVGIVELADIIMRWWTCTE